MLEQLDKNDPSILSYDVIEALNDMEQQFGPTKYGKIKESGEALFWLGYLYRYISYTRNVSTKFLFKTFNYKELLPLYYVYHTQDMEWCVKSLLEKYEIDEKYFKMDDSMKSSTIEDVLSPNETIFERLKPNKTVLILESIFKGLPFVLIWATIDIFAIVMIATTAGFLDENGNNMLWFIIPFFALHLIRELLLRCHRIFQEFPLILLEFLKHRTFPFESERSFFFLHDDEFHDQVNFSFQLLLLHLPQEP